MFISVVRWIEFIQDLPAYSVELKYFETNLCRIEYTGANQNANDKNGMEEI